MAFAWAPDPVLHLVAGFTMAILAGWLLILNPRSPLHLSFSAFLVFRSLLAIVPLVEGTAFEEAAEGAAPLLEMSTLFLVPLFTYHFQKCHCIAHIHGNALFGQVVAYSFMVAPFLMAGLYVWQPELYAGDLDRATLSDPSTTVGPLFMVTGLQFVILSWVGFLFLAEYFDSPTPLHRLSYLVTAAGLCAWPLYVIVSKNLLWVADGVFAAGLDWVRWATLCWEVLALGIVIVAIVQARRHARTARSMPQAKELDRYLMVLGLAILTALVPAALLGINPGAAQTADDVFGGLWALSLPLFITYAVLKHHLFDIDFKLRRKVRQGTVAASFVAAFFVVSEGAQTVLSARWGPYLGLAAAGLLVFALAPLQRFADRVAGAAMPGAKPMAEAPPGDRAVFFREQVHVAWRDGQLNAKERLLLDNLRVKLGLTLEEAHAIEAEAIKDAGGMGGDEGEHGETMEHEPPHGGHGH